MTTNKLVIGVSGTAQAGKDTFAARLVQAHGFHRIAFADKLREALYALNPIVLVTIGESSRLHLNKTHLPLVDLVDMRGWDAAKTVDDVRRLLQRMGTEAGRDVFGEDVWVDAIRDEIDGVNQNVVITDVRFPNELDFINEVGTSVRVTRGKQTQLPGANGAHASETALADKLGEFKYEAPNDGTIADLHDHADILVDVLEPEE